MVLDYSEKKTVRQGLERKPLQKNRPRKESSALVPLLTVAVLLATFGAGVFTGWIIFKPKKIAAPAAVVSQAAAKGAPAQAVPQAQPAPAPDAPLTFYQTLPAGGKGALGSGLNLKKPEPAAHPAPAPAAAAPAAPAAAPATAPEAAPPTAPAAAPKDEEKQKPERQFVVQVASYRSKAEAEAAQSKLAAKGMAAYLVESNVADKGTWYRLRVGKHLAKSEADELAGKAGKGAIVLPE